MWIPHTIVKKTPIQLKFHCGEIGFWEKAATQDLCFQHRLPTHVLHQWKERKRENEWERIFSKGLSYQSAPFLCNIVLEAVIALTSQFLPGSASVFSLGLLREWYGERLQRSLEVPHPPPSQPYLDCLVFSSWAAAAIVNNLSLWDLHILLLKKKKKRKQPEKVWCKTTDCLPWKKEL